MRIVCHLAAPAMPLKGDISTDSRCDILAGREKWPSG
jgi:hypothetical protein